MSFPAAAAAASCTTAADSRSHSLELDGALSQRVAARPPSAHPSHDFRWGRTSHSCLLSQLLSATPVLYTAPVTDKHAYGRFIIAVTNVGNSTLAISVSASPTGAAVEPSALTLAARATAVVKAHVPTALLSGSGASLRLSESGNSSTTLLLLPLRAGAFPATSSTSSSSSSEASLSPAPKTSPASYDAGSQAALVICGLLLAVGVGYYSRRRYRNSLLQQHEQQLQGQHQIEREQLLGPSLGRGFDHIGPGAERDLGGEGVQLGLVSSMGGGQRKGGRLALGGSAPMSPRAVGLVLGAGTVVATPQEAVLGGAQARQSHQRRSGGGGAASGAAASASPNWDGWGEADDGWDLSDSSLLGSDTEQEPRGAGGKKAPPPALPAKPQQASTAAKTAAAPPHNAANNSDSDWEA